MSTSNSSNLETAILANADQFTRLWDAVADFDDVEKRLKEQKSLLSDIEKQIAKCEKSIKEMEKQKQNLYIVWEESRKSSMRRTFAKLSTKATKNLEEEVLKAQSDYLDAIRNEQSAQEHRSVLEQMAMEGVIEKEKLQYEYVRLSSLKKELEHLYSQTFEGPSDLPEEDEVEYKFLASQREFDGVTMRLSLETVALDLLNSSNKLMTSALGTIRELKGASSYSRSLAQSNLKKAEKSVSDARNAVREAAGLCSSIQPLPVVSFDLDYNNSESYRWKYKRMHEQARAAHEHIKAAIRTQEHLKEATEESLKPAKDEYERTNQCLIETRMAIVKRVISQGPRPPEYLGDTQRATLSPARSFVAARETTRPTTSYSDIPSSEPPPYTA